MSDVVQGLWVGSRLTAMERLSVSSFLANGHDYHLYVYGEVGGIPEKAVVKDAGAILPASEIFEYKHSKSYAGFANFFRYKLLLERGGWWVDTDGRLRPFDFAEGYVFACEMCDGREYVNNGIIKAPPASDVMAYAWGVCQSKDQARLAWGETGPRLLTEAVGRFSLEAYKKDYRAFCPLGYLEWGKVIDGGAGLEFDESVYAVHLWNEMWRREGKDKDAAYDPDCLYEQLKRRYLLD